jgi:predicted RNA-binding protein YlxR (DUF448 family)
LIIPRWRMKKNTSSTSAAKPLPQRTCAVCRKVKGKKEMVRLVRTPGGSIEIDATGKKEGRGAYLCRDLACWEKAPKGKQLEHAFKGEINRENMEQLIKNGKDLLKE